MTATMKTLSALALATGCLLAGTMNHASALPNNTDAGLWACYDWCDAHNKTQKSRLICYGNCTNYYVKHPGLSEGQNFTPISNPPTHVATAIASAHSIHHTGLQRPATARNPPTGAIERPSPSTRCAKRVNRLV